MRRKLCLSTSILALVCCGAVHAQEAPDARGRVTNRKIEEVVVTAERRRENLMKTPISADVLTGADLANKAVTSVDDLQFISPSLTIDNFGQGIDFNIRGIGKGEHNTQTLPGVITYRDGVPTFPGYFTEEPYYDIASVQVLRGPQGTFVGENATGGAVFVTSNDPVIGGGYNGYVQAQYGNYNDESVQGGINIPLGDTLAARLSFYQETRASFFSIRDADPADNCPGNKFAGCKPGYNPGDMNWFAGRLSLLWTPTTHLKVSLKYDGDYLDSGNYADSPYYAGFKTLPYGSTTPNPYYSDLFHTSANHAESALDRFQRVALQADYTFDNGIDLRSITGFQTGSTQWETDLDATDYGNIASAGSPKNWFLYDHVDETILSEEINLISPSTGRVQWVAGLFGQTDNYTFPKGLFTIGVPGVSEATSSTLWGRNPEESVAAFGQISVKIVDGLEAQFGARYSYNRTTNNVTWDQYGLKYTESGVYEASYALTYKGSLNWTIDENNFVYGFVATGYKPGGLNPPIYNIVVPAPFGPEKVTSYEAGWKATMLDGHVRTTLDGYYNSYKNFIVTISYPNLPIPGFSTEVNDPNRTKSYGIEAEADAAFGNLSMDFGLGWMHSSLGTFYATDSRPGGTAVPCNPSTGPVSATCVNLAGHSLSYAPDFTFNVGAQYRFDLPGGDTLTPRFNYGYVSGQWATLFDNPAYGDRLAPRGLLNAQLEWGHGNWLVTLYGTNLTDRHYEAALISGLRMAGAPRQFGIRVMKVF